MGNKMKFQTLSLEEPRPERVDDGLSLIVVIVVEELVRASMPGEGSFDFERSTKRLCIAHVIIIMRIDSPST